VHNLIFKEISNTYDLKDWIRCIGQVGLNDPALWLHQFHFKRTSAHPNCSTSCNQRGSLKLFFCPLPNLLNFFSTHVFTLLAQLPTKYPIHPHYISLNYPPTLFTQATYLHHPFSKVFFLLSNMAIIIAIRRKSFWWYHRHWNLRGRVVSRLGLVVDRNNACVAIFRSTFMYINWKGEI